MWRRWRRPNRHVNTTCLQNQRQSTYDPNMSISSAFSTTLLCAPISVVRRKNPRSRSPVIETTNRNVPAKKLLNRLGHGPAYKHNPYPVSVRYRDFVRCLLIVSTTVGFGCASAVFTGTNFPVIALRPIFFDPAIMPPLLGGPNCAVGRTCPDIAPLSQDPDR